MSSIFAIDAIAADVQEEFTAKGVTAEVLVGEWETFKAKSNARVIFGLGDASGQAFGQNLDHYGPGVMGIPTSDTTSARPLWVCLQRIIVWVAFPPDKTLAPAKKAITARQGTWDLCNSTLKAMWHSHGGYFPWDNLTWLNEDQGDRLYGGALRFEATIPVPVLDDDLTIGVGEQFQFVLTEVDPDGTEHPQGSSSGP
jgi:hypothetical protein